MTVPSHVDVSDSEFEETTSTRTELLLRRGYDLDHDGHVVAQAAGELVSLRETEVRCCVICQKPIAADRLKSYPRTVTCGDGCAHKRTAQRQKAYNQRANPQKKGATVTVITPSTPIADGVPVQNCTATPAPADDDRLINMVQRFTAVGLSVGMEIDGIPLRVYA
jgi:hypothetical protein